MSIQADLVNSLRLYDIALHPTQVIKIQDLNGILHISRIQSSWLSYY